jgi:uncharacterized membrane protein YphA (DoxX/SURF4 family)
MVTFRLVAFQYTTKRYSNYAIYLRMADSSRMASVAIWILIVLTAFAFAAAGILKLVGDPMFSDSFGKMGLPGAFGYFIGCCEIAGAVGLFIRRLATLAAAGLAIIMLGAIGYNLGYEPLADVIPAAILFIFSLIIVAARRSESVVFRPRR